MIVLSVDVGSVNFAFSILKVEGSKKNDDLTFELIKCEYVYLDDLTVGAKLVRLLRLLNKEVKDHAVEMVIYEDSKFSGRSAPSLHYVCGAIHTVAALNNLPIKNPSPSHVKKKLCGKGNADKKEVELAVLRLLNDPKVSFLNDHCSDATAVGICSFV